MGQNETDVYRRIGNCEITWEVEKQYAEEECRCLSDD